MGSSAKKKKEKKKDFQKPKLKVGKARPKNTNATDTSFVAKSITLKDQSLSERAPDHADRFRLQLSLLSSKSDAQRRDALAYLAHTLNSSAAKNTNSSLPAAAGAILAKAQPLIMDDSASVRQNTLKLLRALPAVQLGDADMRRCFLLTMAGMTHMAEGVRRDSLDMMAWMLDVKGEAAVGGQGHWVKGLTTWQNLLSWHGRQAGPDGGGGGNKVTKVGSWTSIKPSATKSAASAGNKLLVVQLNTLASFLAAGLRPPPTNEHLAANIDAALFPLSHPDAHIIGTKSNPFAALCLFGPPADAATAAYESSEERAAVFTDVGFREPFEVGVKEAKREAGEVGRAAWGVEKAMRLAGEAS